MSLLLSLRGLKLNNLNVHYSQPDSYPCSFLLVSFSGKIVALGWQVEDTFKEEKYFFYEKFQLIKATDELHQLMSDDDWNNWTGELFLINNYNIWHVSANYMDPISEIRTSIEPFIRNIKSNFPELRSAAELSDQELNTMYSKIESLACEKQKLSDEIENRDKRIAFLSSCLETSSKECDSIKSQLKRETIAHDLIRKQRNFLLKGYNEKTLNQLTTQQRKSLISLLDHLGDIRKDQYSPNEIPEINNDFLAPCLIVKIPVIETIDWDSVKIPAVKYEYRIMDKDGNLSDLSMDTIRANPDAIFDFGFSIISDDLKCCVPINKEYLI
jgi:hypothetical protein